MMPASMRRPFTFLLATGIGLLIAPGASAAIKIYETSEDAFFLGKIRRGECVVRGEGNDRRFKAKGRTVEGGYRLKVIIDQWRGYNREYDFRYGTSNPGKYHIYGVDGPFSNLFAPPGTRGLLSGSLGFARNGKRMGVGFLPTGNQQGDEGVVLAGFMRC